MRGGSLPEERESALRRRRNTVTHTTRPKTSTLDGAILPLRRLHLAPDLVVAAGAVRQRFGEPLLLQVPLSIRGPDRQRILAVLGKGELPRPQDPTVGREGWFRLRLVSGLATVDAHFDLRDAALARKGNAGDHRAARRHFAPVRSE
jgi:hypothetical protein